MAKEIVEAVKEAELKAAQLEKEVLKQYDTILLEAEEKAKSIISSMTKEALMKAQNDLDEAKHKGLAKDVAMKNREREINRLQEVVKAKKQDAIERVLLEII